MKLLGAVERWLIIAIFMVDTFLVIFQVVNRSLLHLQAPWSEEAARYLTIWLSLLAGAYAFRRGQHIYVDMIVGRYGPNLRFMTEVLSALITIGFSIVIVIYGCKIFAIQWHSGQVSAALKAPMWLMYLSIPVGYGLTIAEVGARLWGQVKARLAQISQEGAS